MVICNEEDAVGRARGIGDEERVLQCESKKIPPTVF